MSQTVTVAIVAVAGVGLILLLKAQSDQNQLLLAKTLSQPTVINTGAQANPLSSLASLAGAVAAFI